MFVEVASEEGAAGAELVFSAPDELPASKRQIAARLNQVVRPIQSCGAKGRAPFQSPEKIFPRAGLVTLAMNDGRVQNFSLQIGSTEKVRRSSLRAELSA